jgi:hypothetical protein
LPVSGDIPESVNCKRVSLVEIALTCGARADAARVVVVLEVVVVVAATGAATCTQRKLRPLLAVQRNVPALVTRSRPATLQLLPGCGAADATETTPTATQTTATATAIRLLTLDTKNHSLSDATFDVTTCPLTVVRLQ